MIKELYTAWEQHDQETIETLLSTNLYGVRLYTEDVFYTRKDVVDFLLKTPIKINQVTAYQEGNIIYFEVTYKDGTHTTGKATIKDNAILKLYETIYTDQTRIKVLCSYDGSAYNGYQKQPSGTTIQDTLEVAIQKALSLKERPTIHASGRTDKGVHAHHQVFHTDITSLIPVGKMKDIFNTYLKDDIHILSVEQVEQTFHSRYDVVSKTYQYVINTKRYNPIQRNYEWYIEDLDITAFKGILQEVVGTHDFHSFTTSVEKDTVRTIYDISIRQDNEHLRVFITGNGFLRYMVRYIIMAAVLIAKQKLPYTMNDLFTSKDVGILKEMAPAPGLYLEHVSYEEE